MKILMVEDDLASRRLLEKYLKDWGHEVASAEDGAQGWEMIQSGDFPMVISDWMMPNVDGPELIRRIRDDQRLPYVYIILLTAKSTKGDIIAGLESGADDFVSKPFDKDELRVRIRAAERIVRLEQHLAERNQKLEMLNQEILAANRRMKREMEAGARIQQALLPASLPDCDGFRFAWSFKPCDELAGDILNVFPLDDDHVGVYVLDVSGHGVAAALLSVTVGRLLTSMSDATSLLHRREGTDGKVAIMPPAEVATELNRRFAWNPVTKQYFTLCYGVLNKRTRIFRYVSAGHPGPLYLPHDQDAEIIEEPAFPIGMIQDAVYAEQSLELRPGDRVYLYSDGITDALNPKRQPFAKDRLIRTLEKHRALPLDDSLHRLLDSVITWSADSKIADDISMVALEAEVP